MSMEKQSLILLDIPIMYLPDPGPAGQRPYHGLQDSALTQGPQDRTLTQGLQDSALTQGLQDSALTQGLQDNARTMACLTAP